MPRWVKFTVLGLIAAVVLFFGAIFLYAKVLNDSPDEFTAADIDAALSAEAADDAAAIAEGLRDRKHTGDGRRRRYRPRPASTIAEADPVVTTAAPVAAASQPVGRHRCLAGRLPGGGGAVRRQHDRRRSHQSGHRLARDRRDAR